MKCDCCESELRVAWCDTHGVGACTTCGLPYTIYHYEEVGGERKSVDKPPSVAVKTEWLPLARQYWNETKRRVFPATFDMGILRGRERSYSGATEDDIEKFNSWLEQHKTEWPKQEEAAA